MEKQSILVNGYAYPNIKTQELSQWLQDLTFVSSFSYGFTQEGELIQLDDEKLVEQARMAGVESLMVLTPMNEQGQFSNELVKALLNNPEAQKNLLNNIYENLQNKNMFGVDFDFEYVYEENRAQYTKLVEDASVKLNNEGYLVTVALAPKTSSDQKGLLYQGHDYRGMGMAANFVLLMTYEWGYTYGPPMAVAPINQVRKVLDYGITEIPPDKILMGIPNYGYDWLLPFVKGESRAEKITNDEAVLRAERYGAQIKYDEVAQSPYYFYTDENGRIHEVWFEDARSMKAKLELVEEYGLAGVSYWNIMNFFSTGSEVLNSMYTVEKVNEQN